MARRCRAVPWQLCLLLGAPHALAGNTPTCIENTGGGCALGKCFDSRGPTRCDGLRCFCESSCSGSDGICRPAESSPYVLVAGGQEYRIRNARWADQYMYARSPDGLVLTSTDTSGDGARWTITVPPSGEQDPAFLIYPKRYADSPMKVDKTSNSNGKTQTSVQCFKVTGKGFGAGNDFAINEITMNLVLSPVASPIPNQTLVMLSSQMYSSQYLYISSTGVGIGGTPVDVWTNDPGAGGYWYFEPPLPSVYMTKLRPYSGPRCSLSCGSVSGATRGGGLTTALWTAVSALAASLLVLPSAGF